MDRRKNKASESKTMTKLLNMDLKEILREQALRYLPAKTLYRSLAVCRDWKLQISAPFFVHNQSVSFNSISGFFLQSPNKPPTFISLDPMAYGVPDQHLNFLPEAVDLLSSSNGLLFCQGRSGDKPYYVCNPVNKQWKKLPKHSTDHGSKPAIVLMFEPSLLNFMTDYKVVCIFASTDIEDAYEFEIYSSLQDSWKVSQEMFFNTRQLHFSRGICFNGVAYWYMNCGKILNFDVKKEKATSGYCTYNGTSSWSLGMADGKLCKSYLTGNCSIQVSVQQFAHAYTMPKSHQRTNAWLMRDVKLDPKTFGNKSYKRVLLTWDTVVLFIAGEMIYSHDMRTQTTTVLCSAAHIDPDCHTFPYVNSLVCLT